MPYIKRNGKVYEQTVSEVEIDLAYEEQKLQGWKDALVVDANDFSNYQNKLAEIDALVIPDEYKEKLKLAVPFFSGSGVKQGMVDEVQTKVDAIKAVIDAEKIK